ncbi:MAG: hypothetical protein ACLUBZ_17620 [Ruthenibacterium lactatiformans]|uniref:hypothetical protein n=1 Tax=Ruthenibacterium lactatiformans TaxID=1550024 RepID=UPI0039932AB7
MSAKAKAEEYGAAAEKCGGTLKIHIKVDTASRLGFLCAGEHLRGAAYRPFLCIACAGC